MSDEFIGRTLGDFTIRSRLGGGGGGDVYLAEQLTLGREAVIKVLIAQQDVSAANADRFLREARLASRLDHPFAAHVYAFGAESDGVLWIAMELVRGTPLDQVIKTQGPMPLARFVPVFDRLCEVVKALHDQGIVHRDLKPANVMVIQRAGRLMPKLLDLGIARATSGSPIESRSIPASSRQGSDVTFGSENDSIDDSLDTSSSQDGVVPDQTLGADLRTSNESLVGRLSRSSSGNHELTQAGLVVGTPHFMAPEQWIDASSVDARADIYSLAIFAFQCLTGELPFKSKSLIKMARAHSAKALPQPAGLPDPIFKVLQKGAAKRVEDRYQSPLEFASALRDAAGIGIELASLPQLPEGLRANILSQAPQPLAESVSLLEGARTARQATESAHLVVQVLIRYLGILALSARVRVGPGAAHDAADVPGLMTKLKKEGLDNAEWLQLTAAFLQPFATRRDAHPLPELVRFFDTAASGGLAQLKALLDRAIPGKEASEEQLIQHLLELVPALAVVLERCAFLLDYTLVVQREEPERWMGTRRSRRLVHRLVEPAPAGGVVLADALGTAVEILSPLMQCIAPSGGVPDELFMLEGPGRHGARLVGLPTTYERQDETLWAWLVTHGLLPPPTGTSGSTEVTPYKGLSTFSTDDADNYFGREKEAESFANRLRREPFLAVVGPSGTGKSSFILAGVLPLLPPEWQPVVFRPGVQPLLALRSRLETEKLPSPEGDANKLINALPEGKTLVLVVDQFEELVTLCQDSTTRDTFAQTLLAVARHPSGRARVVVTLRDDFLIKIQQLGAFRESLSNSLQLLGTPAFEDLQRVVTHPARRVGYSFDDASLPRRMVEAVAEYPGALALLSFTASQLWELRDRHLRLMRAKTYDALGGVGGALANHAEATLASLSAAEQKQVREIFRHLVTAQGTRAVLSRREALEVLGGGTAQQVLEKLVTARLLVSSETASGDDSVEIIHEALITAWPRLVGWQREDAELARLRDSLRASARQWEERARPSGLLWRKETLAEYRIWRRRFPGRLTQLEEAFAAASLRDEARSLLIRRALIAVAFAVLSVGLVVLYLSDQESRRNAVLASEKATEAKNLVQRLWLEQGRLALVAHKPLEAWPYLEAAKNAGAAGNDLDLMQRLTAFELQGSEGPVTRLDGTVYWVRASPDERWVLACSVRGAALIDVEAKREVVRWDGTCDDANFSADGRSAIVMGGPNFDRKTLRLIDIATREEKSVALPFGLFTLQRLGDGLVGTVLGSKVVKIDAAGAATPIYEFPGAELLTVTGWGSGAAVYGGRNPYPSSPKGFVAIDPSGRERWRTQRAVNVTLVRASEADGVALFLTSSAVGAVELATGKERWFVDLHAPPVDAAAVAGLALIASDDGVLRSVDLKSGEIRYARPLASALNRIIPGPRGTDVFVASKDGLLLRVDPGTGRVLWEHHGHLGRLSHLTSARGQIFTGGDDGTVWSWSPLTPEWAPANVSVSAVRARPLGFIEVADHALRFVNGDGGVNTVAMPWVLDGVGRIDSRSDDVLAIERTQGNVWLNDAGWQEANPLGRASISVDGQQVLTWSEDGSLVLQQRGGETQTFASEGVTDALLLDDDVGQATTTGTLRVVKRAPPHDEHCHAVAHAGTFSIERGLQEGTFKTIGDSDGQAHLWRDCERLASLRELGAGVIDVQFDLDRKLATALNAQGDVRWFDLTTGLLLARWNTGLNPVTAAFQISQQTLALQPSSGSLLRLQTNDAAAPKAPRLPLVVSGNRLAPRDNGRH